MTVVRPTRLPPVAWPGGYIGEGPERSTFGEPLSARADLACLDDLDKAHAAAQQFGLLDRDPTEVLTLDADLAYAQFRRWRMIEGGVLTTNALEYVPGDLAAIRYDLVVSYMPMDDPNPNEKFDAIQKQRIYNIVKLLTGATPYFLPHDLAWEIMAADITKEDRDDIRLAAPSLVLFSSGLGIPTEYLGIDPLVLDRVDYSQQNASLDPDGPSDDPLDHGPLQLKATSLALLQNYSQLQANQIDQPALNFQLLGALLLPDTDGTLLDTMVWVVRSLNPDLSDQQIVSDPRAAVATGAHPYSLIPALRSNAAIAPVAEALAAVVAWGQWTNPGPPIDGMPERKERRSKAFQRRQEQGGTLGVHTIAIRPAAQDSASHEEPSRSVRSHYRRGYWRRTRVGPRNDWHYERRYIGPTIVNPSSDPIERALTVYRLPLPNVGTGHGDDGDL